MKYNLDIDSRAQTQLLFQYVTGFAVCFLFINLLLCYNCIVKLADVFGALQTKAVAFGGSRWQDWTVIMTCVIVIISRIFCISIFNTYVACAVNEGSTGRPRSSI